MLQPFTERQGTEVTGAGCYVFGRHSVWASAKPPTGNEDKRKLSACLFLNDDWREESGAHTTVYAFDETNEGSFRARSHALISQAVCR